jgi:acetyltransferase
MASLKLGLAQAQVEILRLLLDDPQVDGVVILLNCYKATGYESLKDLVEGIVDEAAKTRDKPVALWAFGLNQQEIIENAEARNVVAGFTSPERAARALAGLHRYHNEIKDRASESTPVFEDVKTGTVTDIIRQTRGNGVNLLGSEPLDILAAYGINAATVRLARSKDEAMRLADEMGYPVVLKIACPQVVHKSDVGGVRLNLQDATQLRAAYDEMVSTVKARVPQTKIDGLVVQKYCGNGIEVIIGAKRSSSFGPLIVFGLGGIYTEVLKDVAFGLAPLKETEARSMISAVKSSAVLAGARGREAADLDALVECILRVSQLVVDFPQIQELDINPLIVGPEGLEAVDARAVLEA